MDYTKFKQEKELEARETIITFNDKDDFAVIYTASVNMAKKLEKLSNHMPNTYKLHKQYGTQFITGVEYICPKKFVIMKKQKEYTEEERRAMAERFRAKIANP